MKAFSTKLTDDNIINMEDVVKRKKEETGNYNKMQFINEAVKEKADREIKRFNKIADKVFNK